MDEQYAYRTGRTDPAKSSRGIMAVLLILVIFLGGLVSVLSILNIHLFRQLKDTWETPVSFAEGELTMARTQEDCLLLAGMALQEPDPVYQELHDLPRGLYVMQVEPGSQAEKLHISPGDVIIALDNAPVSSIEALKTHMQSKKVFRLSLWRNGREIALRISQ